MKHEVWHRYEDSSRDYTIRHRTFVVLSRDVFTVCLAECPEREPWRGLQEGVYRVTLVETDPWARPTAQAALEEFLKELARRSERYQTQLGVTSLMQSQAKFLLGQMLQAKDSDQAS